MLNGLRSLLKDANDGVSKLIVDGEDYGQKVLLQEKAIPWHDATAYANHLSQLVALLKPQVAVISLDKMIIQELADNQNLSRAMGEKTRASYALKTFMSHEDFKKAVSALVASSVQTLRIPVIVQLPSPLQMLYLTTSAAQPDTDYEFNDDDAENAAIYFADWLRTFKDNKIAGLIFDERGGKVAEASYQPIRNIAEHYQWVVGMRRAKEIIFIDPKINVAVLPKTYWTSGTSDIESSGVLFAEILQDAVPEQVLDFREKLS